MTKLKPVVKLNKIVLGVLYFEVTVARNGKMYIGAPFIIRKIEHNYRKIGPFAHITVLGGMYDDNYLTTHGSLTDMGIGCDDVWDNAHRLFRYKHNVFAQMSKIVEAQDLAKYIEIISGNGAQHTIESLTSNVWFYDFIPINYDDYDDYDDYTYEAPRSGDDEIISLDAPQDTALSRDNFDDFEVGENPFKVGDKVMLNGVMDTTLVGLGFKKRKHYTIIAINEAAGLVKVDDANANPQLDNYANHAYFKAVPAKAAKEKAAA